MKLILINILELTFSHILYTFYKQKWSGSQVYDFFVCIVSFFNTMVGTFEKMYVLLDACQGQAIEKICFIELYHLYVLCTPKCLGTKYFKSCGLTEYFKTSEFFHRF
jgi:hypothetical protein